MLHMVIQSSDGNKDIIQENNYKCIQMLTEYAMHQMHEICRVSLSQMVGQEIQNVHTFYEKLFSAHHQDVREFNRNHS